jgi:hypothetical protein
MIIYVIVRISYCLSSLNEDWAGHLATGGFSMVTKTGLALAPKQFKFWKRILEYCGDGDMLSYQELENLCAEIYVNAHISQIGFTFELFVREGLLLKVSDEEFLIKKDTKFYLAKDHVAQKRGADRTPGIKIIARREMIEIKNAGFFTRGRKWQ